MLSTTAANIKICAAFTNLMQKEESRKRLAQLKEEKSAKLDCGRKKITNQQQSRLQDYSQQKKAEAAAVVLKIFN